MAIFRITLLTLAEFFTGKERYFPPIEWSRKSLIHNLFRTFEYFCGRASGVRKESVTYFTYKKGRLTLRREFFTWEARLAYAEAFLRERAEYLVPFFITLFKPSLGFTLAIAAITRDASSSGYEDNISTSLTFSQTCTGTQLTLYLGEYHASPGTRGRNTPTYSGVGFTDITNSATGSGGSFASRLYLCGLINPATGTNNVVISEPNELPDRLSGSVVSYTGTNQVSLSSNTSVGGNQSGGSTNESTTLTISVNNSVGLAAASVEANDSGVTYSAKAGATLFAKTPNGSSQPTTFLLESSPLLNSIGTVSLGWSYTGGAATSGLAAVAVEPAQTGGSVFRALLGVGI